MFKTIKDIDLTGKRVLIRVDYNVTLTKEAKVADDFRLEQSLATLKYLISQNCLIYLLSHLGRPQGKKDKHYSLKPIGQELAKLLGRKVYFSDQNYTTKKGREKLKEFEPGDVVLLENVRFFKGERQNSLKFARQIASLADVFVNDAFGACHRRQASVVGIPQFLPSVAGLLLEKEIKFISQVIENPPKPLVAIVGGAKMEDKLPMIGKLVNKADFCLIGGKIANAFLKVKELCGGGLGERVGRLYLSAKEEKLVKDLFVQAAQSNTALVLPLDLVRVSGQPLDIGRRTIKLFSQIIRKAKTIIWVGPMGLYEQKRFSQGTEAVYKAVAQNRKSLSIVGGGNTLAALKHKKYLKTIDHVSTGGGAMLEFIEKGILPGIKVLGER